MVTVTDGPALSFVHWTHRGGSATAPLQRTTLSSRLEVGRGGGVGGQEHGRARDRQEEGCDGDEEGHFFFILRIIACCLWLGGRLNKFER